MFSIGGGSSDSSSRISQDVWGPQGDALTNMYGGANNLYNMMLPYSMMGFNMIPSMMPYMQSAANMGMQGMEGLLGGGSYGDTSQVRDALFSNLSNRGPTNTQRMYADIIGGEGNSYIDPLVESMKTSHMDNLSRMQAGTGLDAAAAGQGGSSRHAMQNAMLGAQANKDMLGLENQLRAGAYDTDLNWKMDIAKMADTNALAKDQQMMDILGGQDQNMMAAMQYGPMMQNLTMGMMAPWMQSMMMPWMNMQNYSGVLGDPTVLSKGKSSSGSFDLGFGIG